MVLRVELVPLVPLLVAPVPVPGHIVPLVVLQADTAVPTATKSGILVIAASLLVAVGAFALAYTGQGGYYQ